MRVKLQLVLCSDDGREETVTDIVSLNKDCHRLEHLGLTLAESKQLLKRLQQKRLRQQIDHYLASRSQCPDCGATLKAKSSTNRSFRTVFGTCKLRQSTALPLPLPAAQDRLVPTVVGAPDGVRLS